MELEQLYGLMERFSASGLTALEWERGEERVVLRKEQPAAPAAVVPSAAAVPAAPAEAADRNDLVTAPLVGIFYAASAPEEPAYVVPGAQVKKGETLCLIEAMKMMSEIPAPADCVVEEILVQDGEAVGVGAPLFRIRRV